MINLSKSFAFDQKQSKQQKILNVLWELVLNFVQNCFGNKMIELKITALAITPDGKYFITGGEDKNIKFFDLEIQQEVYCLTDAHTSISFSKSL